MTQSSPPSTTRPSSPGVTLKVTDGSTLTTADGEILNVFRNGVLLSDGTLDININVPPTLRTAFGSLRGIEGQLQPDGSFSGVLDGGFRGDGTFTLTPVSEDNPPVGNLPPEVRLVSPNPEGDIALVPGTTFEVEASDPDGEIVSVEYYLFRSPDVADQNIPVNDALLLGTVDEAPYTFTWEGPNERLFFVNQDVKLVIAAVDDSGLRTLIGQPTSSRPNLPNYPIDVPDTATAEQQLFQLRPADEGLRADAPAPINARRTLTGSAFDRGAALSPERSPLDFQSLEEGRNRSTTFVTYNFYAETAGSYELEFLYALQEDEPAVDVRVNGEVLPPLDFPVTSSLYDRYETFSFPLDFRVGFNKVRLSTTEDLSIRLAEVSTSLVSAASGEPVRQTVIYDYSASSSEEQISGTLEADAVNLGGGMFVFDGGTFTQNTGEVFELLTGTIGDKLGNGFEVKFDFAFGEDEAFFLQNRGVSVEPSGDIPSGNTSLRNRVNGFEELESYRFTADRVQ